MLKFSQALLFSATLFLASCGGGNTPQKEAETTDTPQEATASTDCMYAFNKDSVTVSWTAFKTTEKIGVGGTFDQITIEGTENNASITNVFSNASFSIPVASINTNNPDRDKKIQEFFFGKLVGAETLTGKVVSIAEDKAVVAITLNGVEKEVEMDVATPDQSIALEAVIDVTNWNAQAGVDGLNEACHDLHMAGDGVSKLWPDVKISITSVLDKTCK